MTEIRPLVSATVRYALGAAVGLGLAWQVLSQSVSPLGPSGDETFVLQFGPSAGGFEITLQR